MLKSRRNLTEDVGNMAELLCERYLPRVFQYINYWVNDTKIAEELTLKALKKALVKYKGYYSDEKKFSTEIFADARKEVQDCLKIGTIKPILPELSTQEQEIISLRLAAVLNNRMISKLTGLSESKVSTIVHHSLCKMRNCMEVPA